MKFIEKAIEKLQNKLLLMLSKAVILATKDDGPRQLIQVDLGNGEIISDVERLQNFGFTSHAVPGAQALVVCFGGNREFPVSIVADDGNFRPEMQEGESCVYNAQAVVINLLADDTIELRKRGTSPLPPTAGVVTGECLSPFTGAPFPDKSAIIKAQKL